MKIIIAKDYNEMSLRAFEVIKDTLENNPRATLGLATGSTPVGLYDLMAEDHAKNGTSYKEVCTVNLDEYVGLDYSDRQSYIYFMRSKLFDRIDINPENAHIEDGKAEDRQAECDRYNRLLEDLQQDVQILGIGSNGHIAFNEPGTPFGSVTHVVDLAESTIESNSRFFEKIGDVPRKAFTMGIKNIMHAKKILVLATGANKAEAVKGLVCGPVSEDLPASVLQLHPDCTLICDEAAAALL